MKSKKSDEIISPANSSEASLESAAAAVFDEHAYEGVDFSVSESYLKNGLSTAEVADRTEKGYINGDLEIRTKTYWQIVRTNVFSLFNILLVAIAILILASAESMLEGIFQCGFLFLVVVNTLSGLIQEVRAKRTIDKLALVSAPKAQVVRNGEMIDVKLSEVVLNDLMVLNAGGQICADAELMDGNIEVNESLITGEPDVVQKHRGDKLLSGSFVASGQATACVRHIGIDNYAQKISSGAKYIKKPNSDIICSLRAIIRIMSIVIVPLGLGIFLKSMFSTGLSVNESILAMSASMLSMIPQGLMALTSVVFYVSVIRLSKHNTLCKDLYCVETLARVDVLCLDKTGTITEGSIQVVDILPAKRTGETEMTEALNCLSHALSDNNPTFSAIKTRFAGEGPCMSMEAVETVPFSSARKWSGATFRLSGKSLSASGNSGDTDAADSTADTAKKSGKSGATVSYMMGAAEFLLNKTAMASAADVIEMYSERGYRVLVLAKSDKPLVDGKKPTNVKLVGFIIMADKIRPEAPATLKYFAQQGVDIKIISGDNPVTVSAIAKRAGLQGAENYIDASTLLTPEDVADAAEKYKVFGRVTPDQKLTLVKALKKNEHTVAMTGDGVNDVLALKEADCSIAMASGSDAARTVAQLVLLDSNFASMPKIVAEGRRNINNVQRTAALYLTKTLYSLLIAVLFILPWMGKYPYEPIHLTFMGGFAIGIPSFLLSFSPNNERVKGKFVNTVFSRSMPGAIALFACILIVQIISLTTEITELEVSTISLMLLASISFMVLYRVCLPFNRWRFTMTTILVLMFFGSWWVLTANNVPWLESIVKTVNIPLVPLNEFSNLMLTIMLPVLCGGTMLMILLTIFFDRYAKKHRFKFVEKILRVDKEKEQKAA